MDQQPTTAFSHQDEVFSWQNFRQGSEKSFTYLHQKYYNDLYLYALKITGDEYSAKNAIQELFVYLWKNRTRLGEVQHIKYYLIFSLRRHILRLLKKEQKHVHLSLADAPAFQDFTFSPEDILITQETSLINEKRVVEALNKLPARQREVIYLKYFQELPNEEIAEVLSLNYQSVLNCLGRASRNLRKLLLSQQTVEISPFILYPIALLSLLL